MKLSLFFALIGCAVAVPGARVRRNVAQLGVMMDCTTEKGYIGGALDYNGYGCWCGLGGEGPTLDDTDKCCQEHDWCYERARDFSGCEGAQIYYVMYDYETSNCESPEASIHCSSKADYGFFESDAACKAAICQCDADLALCFARHRDSFNTNYIRYNNANCV
ncbi:phospholipase A2 AP-PLA2-I-like [Glandiceps talaboti]